MARRVRRVHVLGGGAPLRGDGGVLHLDDARRGRRGAARAGERHHPLRLFIGSGMPRGLWRAGGAALPAGARGRVLRLHRGRRDPGQPAGLQARCDGAPAAGQRRAAASPSTTSTRRAWCSTATGSPGAAAWTRSGCCSPGSARPSRSASPRCARCSPPTMPGWPPAICSAATPTATTGASTASGDVIRTAQGPVFSTPIRDALGDIRAVDLALAYGVAPAGRRARRSRWPAVTLRRDAALTAA